MNKVWLVQVVFTDDCTYSYRQVVAVCTDEIATIKMEEKAKEVYSGYEVEIREVSTNKFLE